MLMKQLLNFAPKCSWSSHNRVKSRIIFKMYLLRRVPRDTLIIETDNILFQNNDNFIKINIIYIFYCFHIIFTFDKHFKFDHSLAIVFQRIPYSSRKIVKTKYSTALPPVNKLPLSISPDISSLGF